MMQHAFHKPEAEILQRGAKMSNLGIIYSLYDGLIKISPDILLIPCIFRRAEKYLHEMNFVEQNIRAYCMSHH